MRLTMREPESLLDAIAERGDVDLTVPAVRQVVNLMVRVGWTREKACQAVADNHWLPPFLLHDVVVQAGVPARWGYRDPDPNE